MSFVLKAFAPKNKLLSSEQRKHLHAVLSESFIAHFNQAWVQWSDEQINSELDRSYILSFWQGNLPVALILYDKLPGQVAEINWLCTALKFKKMGLMTQLVERLKALPDVSQIWLEVSELNQPAILFYKNVIF